MKLNHFSLTSAQFPELEGYLEIAEKMITLTGLRWVDKSWHNDICPNCVSIDTGVPLMLWWDKPEADTTRFALHIALGALTHCVDLLDGRNQIYEGNSWQELLAAVSNAVSLSNRVPWPGGLNTDGNFEVGVDVDCSGREWVRLLVAKGLDYHFDDDPFDQVITGSDGMKCFNRIEAACLDVFVAAYRENKVDLCGLYFEVQAERGTYDDAGIVSVDHVCAKLVAQEALLAQLPPPDLSHMVDLATKEPETDDEKLAHARKYLDDAQRLMMQCSHGNKVHGVDIAIIDALKDSISQKLAD